MGYSYAFQGYQLVAWYWAATTFSIITVAVRLYVDFIGYRKVPKHRDAIVVLALLLYIAITATVSVGNDFDAYNITSSAVSPYPLTTKHAVVYDKMAWANTIVAFTMYCLLKADLLCLYHSLVSKKSHPRLFWMIIVGWLLVLLNWIAAFVFFGTACHPLRPNGKPFCSWRTEYLYTVWSTHLVSEVVIYVIPLVIISQLKSWTFKQKLSASAMFLIGSINILTIVCSLSVQIVQTKHIIPSTSVFMEVYTFTQFQGPIQSLTAFTVVCMPQLKSLFELVGEKVAERRRRRSNWRTSDSSGGSSGGTDNSLDLENGAKLPTPPRPIRKFRKMSMNINVSSIGIGSFRTLSVVSPIQQEYPLNAAPPEKADI